MNEQSHSPASQLRHGLRRAAGRDPHEAGRTATTLELLFDLVFVVAIGQTAGQFAHLFAEGHVAASIGGFLFCVIVVLWAWVGFSWFSSAFDTDDHFHRLATMVQMVGATVVALGVPAIFHSIDSGHNLDNRVVVGGYVVIRIAAVFQWGRSARQAPHYQKSCLIYIWTITIGQIGWIATTFFPLSLIEFAATGTILLFIELAGPYFAETTSNGTPWLAHHIAERYGLLVIIALGEGVIGTVASLTAIIGVEGWTLNAVLVAIAGMGLTFGMWWAFFLISAGDVLHVKRERAKKWAYGSIPIFVAVAATGAGLDVAAIFIQHKAHIGAEVAVLALAVPVGIYLLTIYWLYGVLYVDRHNFHAFLLVLTAVPLIAAPALAYAGVSVAICLLVVMVAPAVTVIGYEAYGYKHVHAALKRATAAETKN